MNDRSTDNDLEARLRTAFRSAALPEAPSRLLDALERAPDAALDVAAGRTAAGRRSGRRQTLGLLGLAAVLVVGGALAIGVGSRPPSPLPAPSATAVPDGLVLTYGVQWTSATPYDAATLDREVAVVRERLDAAGLVGVLVRTDGEDRILVALPAGTDADALRRLIGQRGAAAFVPVGDTQVEVGDPIDPARFPALFGSEGVADATVGTDGNGVRVVTISLTPAATRLFGDYTAANVGSFVAITLDGLVVSAPEIMQAIPGGSVEIAKGSLEGGWDQTEAAQFASFLRSGPLPAPLAELSSESGPVPSAPSS
jgi:hypothetical protein